MLWPLSLPHPYLNVDMSNNQQMSSLVNQMNLPYTDTRFAWPVTGARRVSVRSSRMSTFNDANVMQYGVASSYDFNRFIQRVVNYDFANSNGFYCSCTGSQMVNYWYSQCTQLQLSYPNYPIYNMKCQQYGSNVYVFDFSSFCDPSSVSPALIFIVYSRNC